MNNNLETLQIHLDLALYNFYIITFLLTTILLGAIVISIAMMNHCRKYQNNNRTMWIIAMVIGFPLTSVIYLFFKDKEEKEITEENLIEERLREIQSRNY